MTTNAINSLAGQRRMCLKSLMFQSAHLARPASLPPFDLRSSLPPFTCVCRRDRVYMCLHACGLHTCVRVVFVAAPTYNESWLTHAPPELSKQTSLQFAQKMRY